MPRDRSETARSTLRAPGRRKPLLAPETSSDEDPESPGSPLSGGGLASSTTTPDVRSPRSALQKQTTQLPKGMLPAWAAAAVAEASEDRDGADSPTSPASPTSPEIDESAASPASPAGPASPSSPASPDTARDGAKAPGFAPPSRLAAFRRDSSVTRLSKAPAVAFRDWVQSFPQDLEKVYARFQKETHNAAGGVHYDSGNQGERGVSKATWTRMILDMGFPGGAAAAGDVWDEIAKEAKSRPLAEKRQRGFQLSLRLSEDAEEVTLSQLRRFGKRVVAVSGLLDAQAQGSPASRLVRLLLQKHGSTLLAWREALDLHGSGRVAYTEFTNACRKLGLQTQCKQIWQNLKQDSFAALEFHELDPVEAENLEAFAECLWSAVGFDLRKAWLVLDQSNLQYVSYADFSDALKKMGFQGNRKLIYKGLDSSGLGRMKRSDLDYIAKVARTARAAVGSENLERNSAVTELITWAKREMGGAEELVNQLGLDADRTELQVGELVARLLALGFEGDGLAAASLLARSGDGATVSAATLRSALAGGRPRPELSPRPSPRLSPRPSSPRPESSTGSAARSQTPRSASTRRWTPASAWSNNVDNISDRNVGRCRHTKGFFFQPCRDDELLRAIPRSSSTGALPRYVFEQDRPVKRPAWDRGTNHAAQEANLTASKYCRSYFSDPADKPVRAQRRALLQQRQLGRGL